MKRQRVSYTVLAFAMSVLSGCGGGGSGGADAGTTADASGPFCEGAADGTPCGDATETACSGPDTCLAGACVPNHVAVDTACGDTTDSICNAADTCDGAGMCRSNFAPTSTACGDPTATECNGADTCNGAGTCVANFEDASTACGDPSSSECDQADTCDGAGTCVPNLADANTACGDPAVTPCNGADACNGAGACLPNFAPAASACGDATSSACSYADACDGAGTCQQNHVAANVPCGSALDTECDDPDVCNGSGACLPRFASIGAECGVNGDCASGGCDGSGGCVTQLMPDATRCYDCAAGPGVCNVCTAGVCGEVAFCMETGSVLNGSFAGGPTKNGTMFDVVATRTVTITGFDVSVSAPATLEIYYKVGTWNGFANAPSAWTKLGTGSVNGGGQRVPVRLRLPIVAGQTYAFYVTTNNPYTSITYTAGTAPGAVYASTESLTLLEGAGLDYPFTKGTGMVTQPRVFNGTILYAADTGPYMLSTLGEPYTGDVADGVMFDVRANYANTVMRGVLDVELEPGTHDVDVYFRRGSFVGHEGADTGWVRVGGITGAVSAGGGARTSIPLDAGGLSIASSEVGALYVDTHGTGLRTSPGTTVGAEVISSGAQSLLVGSAIDADFGGVGPAVAFRGAFQSLYCF